ncbi:hypothetical protein Glove_340g58 [Diversispora epigaea]|uniref:Uncharacterized protein n=1 Tax=Diversispora epigaea TaxID=1348612 RepID=A0A397HPI8_9GLOM|nr:hypothetical protein Glove_340g58 [Diversispora epigaea]
MKKVINLTLATNSYEELIGMCQDFLNNKQEILTSQNLVEESISNKELDIISITNPIIKVRKKRPAGKAKSAVEIQNKKNKINYLKPVDFNIQKDDKIQLDKNNRRKCHKCEQKEYNCVTCKFNNED